MNQLLNKDDFRELRKKMNLEGKLSTPTNIYR
jgi:hypothetical protein